MRLQKYTSMQALFVSTTLWLNAGILCVFLATTAYRFFLQRKFLWSTLIHLAGKVRGTKFLFGRSIPCLPRGDAKRTLFSRHASAHVVLMSAGFYRRHARQCTGEPSVLPSEGSATEYPPRRMSCSLNTTRTHTGRHERVLTLVRRTFCRGRDARE